jgi:GNAT superfamily N-acetyltransferase
MQRMLVRPIGAEEWRAWRELRLRALAESPDAFRSTLGEVSSRPDDHWMEEVRRTAGHPDGELWIAELDGVPAGQAFSRMDGNSVHIGAMWVAPEARGRGIGRALLEATEDWGRKRGSTRALLSVTAGNSPAEQLYRASGYERTGGVEPLRDGSVLRCVELAKEL